MSGHAQVEAGAARRRDRKRPQFPRPCSKNLHTIRSNKDLTPGRQCRECKATYAAAYRTRRKLDTKLKKANRPSDVELKRALRPAIIDRILSLHAELDRETNVWRAGDIRERIAAAQVELDATEDIGD